jgi:hypothetical protein
MSRRVRWLREAWNLARTDSRGDTVVALLLVSVAVGPFVLAWWRGR